MSPFLPVCLLLLGTSSFHASLGLLLGCLYCSHGSLIDQMLWLIEQRVPPSGLSPNIPLGMPLSLTLTLWVTECKWILLGSLNFIPRHITIFQMGLHALSNALSNLIPPVLLLAEFLDLFNMWLTHFPSLHNRQGRLYRCFPRPGWSLRCPMWCFLPLHITVDRISSMRLGIQNKIFWFFFAT